MSGFDNEVLYADNVDFSGGFPVSGKVTSDGELLIGSSVAPNIRVSTLTAGSGIAITNGEGSITISSSSTAQTPLKDIYDFDDFLSYGQSPNVSKLIWTDSNSLFQQKNGSVNNPGIIEVQGAIGISKPVLTLSQFNFAGALPYILGGGALNIYWVINLTALSDGVNTYTTYIGMSDADSTSAGLEPDNGCYFRYTDSVNGGNWQIVCANSGVRTATNTAVPANTNFVNLGVSVNADASLVTFYIDSVSVGSVATNIPTVNLGPFFIINTSAGDAPQSQIDLFYYTQTLTNARPGYQGF